MKNVSEKKVVGKIGTHLMFNNFFLENLAVCEKTWKNIMQPDRPQIRI
jgi:hypothetical protein